VEGVALLETLAALHARVGQARVLLSLAAVAAELVGAVARHVLRVGRKRDIVE
jgi:hypothetical protein